jgi:hypothetical protein
MRWLSLVTILAAIGCAETPPPHAMPPPRPWNDPREQLDKRDIVYGMQQIKPAVGLCFDRYKEFGTYEAAVTIGNSGHVTAVHVRGPDRETNDCVGHAVGNASFPAFSGAPQSIVYPFVLR